MNIIYPIRIFHPMRTPLDENLFVVRQSPETEGETETERERETNRISRAEEFHRSINNLL